MKKICLLLSFLLLVLNGCSEEQPKQEFIPTKEVSEETENAEIKALLEGMSLEEKVSQMFLVSWSEEYMESPCSFGGYLFFAKDFQNSTPELFREQIKKIQAESEIPFFIAVDEEGGTVNRVSMYPQFREDPFASPQSVYVTGGMEQIEKDAKEKSEFLLELGINLNLAPVSDVSENPDDFIYERSFGQGAVETAEYVKTVVHQMKEANIGSVLKHFPGYGNNVDTHIESAYDSRSYETFATNDFLPFQAGVEAGAGMVLVSHNVVECMDKEMPASLSSQVLEELRNTLGFEGIIITDDLAMDAIRHYADEEEAAILAILAGNDMICCSNYNTQADAVLDAVASGILSEERIDESVMRILKYKKELGIL